MVDLALKFGPADYFALMVFAFITVAAVLGKSTVRGLTSLFLGLFLGLIGIDSQTGQPRFAFGVPELLDGVDVVVLAVGLFAVGEALYVAAYQSRLAGTIEKVKGSLLMSAADWKRSWPAWLRATAIGFPFGTIPAGGAEIPTFLSYATEKKLTKHPEEFGKGAIEGVAGPEAANNASATGVLVPLLTLGIPTSATAAILLGAFQNYGLQPGSVAVRFTKGSGLGADREPLRRQRDPADPQPAADRHLGEGARDPEGPAVRRHPGVRHARRLQPAPVVGRPRHALRLRPARLRHAALGHSRSARR